MNTFTWPIAIKPRAACQNCVQKWEKPHTADSCRHSWPETLAWAIPAGLALATGKDVYQSLHLHNLTTSDGEVVQVQPHPEMMALELSHEN